MWNSVKHPPEVIMMRMCCRYALGLMPVSDCVPYLSNTLDLQQLMKLLHEERMVLLVYQVLSGDLKPYASPGLLGVLSQKTKVILMRQLALMTSLRDVEGAFKAEKILYMPLKGPSLNHMLWGRKIMRYSGDLDILIAPKDILRANTVLNTLNFKTALSNRQLFVYQNFHQMTLKKDAFYSNEDFSQHIELHWKTHRIELIFKNNDCLSDVVDDEIYLLYLCLHAAKHTWSRLIWLIDIVAFLKHKQLNLGRLRALAKQKHITPVVDEMILLADRWLGIQLLSDADLAQLDKRVALLEKRIRWKKKVGEQATFFVKLLRPFFSNTLSSSFYIQMRLWTQAFLEAAIIQMTKVLKANQA